MTKNYQGLQRENIKCQPSFSEPPFFFLEPWFLEFWLIWKPHTPSFIASDLWDCWQLCYFSASWWLPSPKFLSIFLNAKNYQIPKGEKQLSDCQAHFSEIPFSLVSWCFNSRLCQRLSENFKCINFNCIHLFQFFLMEAAVFWKW